MSTVVTAKEVIESKPQESVAAMILHRVRETPDKEAFRYPDANDAWQSLTWKESVDRSAVIAAGLIECGIEPEERVAIASGTRLEWVLASMAISLAGAAVTTVYPQTGAEDEAFILGDSNSRIVFAENQAQLDKITEKRADLPEVVKVILFDGDGDGEFSISLGQLEQLGSNALAANPDLVTGRAEAVTSDQLATLIYTSGTTGKPKGVELLNSSWGFVGKSLDSIGVMRGDDVLYLWLPMAHVFGSVLLAAAVEVGYATAVDGRVPKIMENLGVIKPTFMGAVPRIFEKIHAGIVSMVKAEGPEKEAGFNWGMDVGLRYHNALNAGEEISPELQAEYDKADAAVLALVRGILGGNIRFFISGSAPLSADIADFFTAAGMPILEGYGLTETSAVGTLCRPGTRRAGYVGEPVPGSEVKIAPDGEILVRSPAVMRGYRNQPDATAEVLDADGWFATGDIGEFDEYDRLKITDRKKDLFKTSGGKYVAPSAIESQFKALCGIASNMVVHANNRKFVSALVTLDPEAMQVFAAKTGKEYDYEALTKDPDVIGYVQNSIDQLNEGLNHWEKVQKFVILPSDLSIESGELTPSLKVKRKIVEQHNQELLDGFYA